MIKIQFLLFRKYVRKLLEFGYRLVKKTIFFVFLKWEFVFWIFYFSWDSGEKNDIFNTELVSYNVIL
jgi:hypothetical protein